MDPTRDDTRTEAPTRRDKMRITRRTAATVVGCAVVAINLLQACGFTIEAIQSPQDVYDILDESRYVEPYAGERWTVVNDPKLRVEHGWSCAEAPSAASQEYIGLRVGGFTELPTNFDGTVFLNGWHLEYKKKDHHVVGLGTSIFNIVQLNNVLVWNAGGLISDHNGDDGYRWCYEYTTVAWPRPRKGGDVTPNLQPWVDIQAVHSDPRAKLMYVDGANVGGVDKIPGSFRTTGKAPRGVLLAGFGMSHTDDDHHVRQIGFDLGKAKIKNKRIKWKSDLIFKDDSTRDPRAAAIVSVLAGQSVNVWQPPSVWVEGGDATPGPYWNDLQLTPITGSSNACLGDLSERTVEMAIVTPPYTWAIPMLTGWDLSTPCGDTHITHVGAWIEDFHYVYTPGNSNGTLYYTMKTNYGDKDNFPGLSGGGVQVSVLGINLLYPPGKEPGTSPGPIGPIGPGPGVAR